ncbi:MAG: hypothetical protein JWQ44_2496 [Chthoniobacter sp.]|nr:hypothetical protein [Chthoniobacter sp.]
MALDYRMSLTARDAAAQPLLAMLKPLHLFALLLLSSAAIAQENTATAPSAEETDRRFLATLEQKSNPAPATVAVAQEAAPAVAPQPAATVAPEPSRPTRPVSDRVSTQASSRIPAETSTRTTREKPARAASRSDRIAEAAPKPKKNVRKAVSSLQKERAEESKKSVARRENPAQQDPAEVTLAPHAQGRPVLKPFETKRRTSSEFVRVTTTTVTSRVDPDDDDDDEDDD